LQSQEVVNDQADKNIQEDSEGPTIADLISGQLAGVVSYLELKKRELDNQSEA